MLSADPNLIYGGQIDRNHNNSSSKGKNKIHPQNSDTARNGQVPLNDENVCEGETKNKPKSRELKGDLITYNTARVTRQKSMIRHMENREKLAQVSRLFIRPRF